jgi:16S rRNA (uracil1498-N3)-methyltransferase
MGANRFHHDPITAGSVRLGAEEGHHFVKVLRGQVGQSIELFDGHGRCAWGVVCQISRAGVFVEIKTVSELSTRQHQRIILAVAAAKGQRFDWMLSKCTEAGTDHIALVHYERSIRLGKESAVNRYQNLTISACKQCGRNSLPLITGPRKLDQTVMELQQQYPQSKLIYGSPEPGARTIRYLADNNTLDTVVFVGPEGGLTAGEVQYLNDRGADAVRVASHVLRTETAGIVFAAILEALRISVP